MIDIFELAIIGYFPLQNASVTQNMSSGVILSTHSLVLQGVTRHNSGSYTCLAANSRGETASKPVNLRVQCKYKKSLFHVLEHRHFSQTKVTYKLFETQSDSDAEKWGVEGFWWSVLFFTGRCSDKHVCSHL